MSDEALRFRKSSYSGQGVNCVEVAHIPTTFRKSPHSGQAPNCVEVANHPTDFHTSTHSGHDQNCVAVAESSTGAAIRDSKYPDAGHLSFSAAEWTAFLTAVKTG
ncbi:DUF397 domain-containing protein [Streptomonospora sediminis]